MSTVQNLDTGHIAPVTPIRRLACTSCGTADRPLSQMRHDLTLCAVCAFARYGGWAAILGFDAEDLPPVQNLDTERPTYERMMRREAGEDQ